MAMNQTARLQSQDVGRENGRAATLQHWGALIGGGALAVYGLTRRSPLGYVLAAGGGALDRKSTRLNSSHMSISYAVFCLKKKKKYNKQLGSLADYARRVDAVRHFLSGDRANFVSAIDRSYVHVAFEVTLPGFVVLVDTRR